VPDLVEESVQSGGLGIGLGSNLAEERGDRVCRRLRPSCRRQRSAEHAVDVEAAQEGGSNTRWQLRVGWHEVGDVGGELMPVPHPGQLLEVRQIISAGTNLSNFKF
jgi:hypothetical protein